MSSESGDKPKGKRQLNSYLRVLVSRPYFYLLENVVDTCMEGNSWFQKQIFEGFN